MVELKGSREVREFLVGEGINKDHIRRIYNDRLVVGRKFKVCLVVFGGALTGEKAVTEELAVKIRNSLFKLGMEDIFISGGKIEFKNRNV